VTRPVIIDCALIEAKRIINRQKRSINEGRLKEDRRRKKS